MSFDPVIAPANLEKLIEDNFRDEIFWIQKAEWILSRIKDWETGKKDFKELKLIFCIPPGNLPKNLTSEEQLIAISAIHTSRELYQNLKISELSLEELEKILGINAPGNLTLVPEPPLYQDCDLEAFPTSPPYSTWFRAAPYLHKWQEKGIHCNSISQRRSVKIQLLGTDLRTGRETILYGVPAKNIIQSLSWDTLRLNLILLMYALRAKDNTFIVKGTDIIKILYLKRTDLNVNLKLAKLKEQFELLRTQSLPVNWHVGKRNNLPNLQSDIEVENTDLNNTKMWIIHHIRYQSIPKKELFVEVTAGKLFSLLYGENNEENNQISYFPKRLLS